MTRFLAGVFGLFLLMSGLVPGARSARASVGVDVGVAAAAGCGAAAVDSGVFTTQVAVNPHHLDFEAMSGDLPSTSQLVGMRCVDVADGSDCSGSISSNQPWLQIDHDRFIGEDTVAVRVDPGALDPGTYEGKIHFEYDFVSVDDTEDTTVTLQVDPNPLH